MNDRQYRAKLLNAWEEIYKKGQLTFWVFLALREGPKHAPAIREFIGRTTGGVITCEDQSLYRTLRKYYDLEMVDFEMGQGNRGPDRKYYRLTTLGNDLLTSFIDRNIRILFDRSLMNLMFGKESE